MRLRVLFASAAVTLGAVLVPTVAQAGVMAEINAAGKVERKVNRMHPGYNPVATCDQIGSRKFWCSYIASRGDCFVSGKARVNYGRVRIVANNKDCF